jgi:hypothetical protein
MPAVPNLFGELQPEPLPGMLVQFTLAHGHYEEWAIGYGLVDRQEYEAAMVNPDPDNDLALSVRVLNWSIAPEWGSSDYLGVPVHPDTRVINCFAYELEPWEGKQ